MCYISCNIEPIDQMLFGDNRLSRAGEDHIISAQSSSPYTIFGAVGSFLANHLGSKGKYTDWNKIDKIKECMGEFIHTDQYAGKDVFQILGYAYVDVEGKTWFPPPSHYRIKEMGNFSKKIFMFNDLLIPDNPPGISSLELKKILRRNSSAENEVDVDFFINKSQIETLLMGERGDTYSDFKFLSDFYLEEFRTGLKICGKKNIAEEHLLFNRPYWRFRRGIHGASLKARSCGITVWAKTCTSIKEEIQNGTGFLGGDRGRAYFRFDGSDYQKKPLQDILDKVCENISESDGFFAYALTPVPVVDSLSSCKIAGKIPVAAAIGKPQYFSGWLNAPKDPRPRRMIHAVPPGSVLFYEWDNINSMEERAKLIGKNWLSSLTPSYACFGFGRILIGVWKCQ